jgi:hypothetical protein
MKLAASKVMILGTLALTLGADTNQGSLPNLAALLRSEGTTLDQHPPVERWFSAGKSRVGRFLDLFVYQQPAESTIHTELGGSI